MRILAVAGLLTLGLSVPGIAYADSDGYFCVGQGYLAYQFGLAPPPVAPHRLSVISTEGAEGIPDAVTLELPQFQIHGIVCGEGWVDIASFTTVYRVTLNERQRPVRYEERGPLDRPIPQAYIRSQLQNLGASGGGRAYLNPTRMRIGVRRGGGEYVLEVVAKAIEPVNRCEIFVTSRIVEIDSGGRQVNERVVFQAKGRRECGDPGPAWLPVG
jgi:hypothetical protein